MSDLKSSSAYSDFATGALPSSTGTDGMWLIVKRGLYFRPDCQGYTGIKDEAGRYKYDLAKDYDRGECKIMREEDGPDFLPAAYNDLVIEHLTKQRDEARAELARVRGAAQGQIDRGALVKALEVERDYWAEEVTDAAADLQEGAAYTDAIRDRMAFCSERAERINRALSCHPAYAAWQPIETAPKDGTRILLFQAPRGAFEGWWHKRWPEPEEYWMDDQDSEPAPTHWQRTLAIPSTDREAGK